MDDTKKQNDELRNTGVVFDAPQREDDAEAKVQGVEHPEGDKKMPAHAPARHQSGSILTNRDDVFDVSNAFHNKTEFGTIVTDKRQGNMTVGKALTGVLGEWARSAKKKVEESPLLKEKEVAKIPAPETRKDIIMKASQKARQAPRDDHSAVVQKMRTLASDAERVIGTPYRIKDKVDTPASWTHTTKEDAAKKNVRDAQPSAQISKTIVPPRGLVAPSVSEHSEFRPEERQSEHVAKEERPEPEVKKPAPEHLVARDALRARRPLPPRQEPRAQSVSQRHFTTRKREEKTKSWWQWLLHFFKREVKVPTIAGTVTPGTSALRESEGAHEEGNQPEENVTVVHEDLIAPRIPKTEPSPIPPKAPPQDAAPLHSEPEVVKENEPEPSVPYREHEPPGTTTETVVMKTVADEQEGIEEEWTPTPVSPPHHSYAKMFFVGVIVAVVAAGGVSSYLLFQNNAGSVFPQEIPQFVSYIRADASVTVPFSDSRNAFLSTVTDATKNAPAGVTQIIPLYSTGAVGTVERAATAYEVFQRIEPRAPSAFIRSLHDTVVIGALQGTEKNEPFIVVKTNSFDVAFAGMIEWEQFMSADLAPLFGEPVARTFDENARTDDLSVPAYFEDVLVQNRGARLLRDGRNDERIIYAFSDPETLVITTSQNALRRIFGILR